MSLFWSWVMELLLFKYKIIRLLFVNKISCTMKPMLPFIFHPRFVVWWNGFLTRVLRGRHNASLARMCVCVCDYHARQGNGSRLSFCHMLTTDSMRSSREQAFSDARYQHPGSLGGLFCNSLRWGHPPWPHASSVGDFSVCASTLAIVVWISVRIWTDLKSRGNMDQVS